MGEILSNAKDSFILFPVFGKLSTLELHSIKEQGSLDFRIVSASEHECLIECNRSVAVALIQRTGGFFKIARNLGSSRVKALQNLETPDKPKFNWTVSSYGVDDEEIDEAKADVQDYLKSIKLGKSRYLHPQTYSEGGPSHKGVQMQEVKLKTLYETILFPGGKVPPGLDFIIIRGGRSEPIFGQTIACSDVLGFEKRDLSRSYQDPTMTMGPRLARLLVNLCMTKTSGTILDPFCGLGTILQEAMMLRYNVVGVDISRSNVQRTRANLSWIIKTYDSTKKLRIEVYRGDSLQLSKEAIPAVQGIATEPILVPKYEENPDPTTARESIESTRLLYTEFLKAARSVLMDGSKMSIVSPAIVDKTGREHRLSLSRAIEEAGFKNYISSEKVEYPIRVESSKRRIVQRDIYLMVAN